MQYKIVNLRVKNFKCFDNTQFYEFCFDYDKNPIILSGPNGFGKTTFFDAIELIFSKDITRLDKGIEKKTTNLGKNILLNKANEDGYVVLTLKNEKSDILTIFAKILNNNHKLELEDSICYGAINRFIVTEELDDFLCSYDDWKNYVDNENLIKYRAKNFNVYYYVSQAESVHFLKRTISDRKNAMNILLNTGFIDERKKVVLDLIGSRNGTKGHLINDEIFALDNELKKKAVVLKTLLKNNIQEDIEKIEYIDLGLYNKDSNLYFWDNIDIAELDSSEIKRGINILQSIISFWENKNDYINYRWNEDILKILKGNSIHDYVDYKEYITNNLISREKIEQQLQKWDFEIQIYNASFLFRQENPVETSYKEEDILVLKKLVPELEKYDFSLIKNIVHEILNLSKTFSTNQKAIDKLTSARNALRNAKNEYDEYGTACPFCNTKFANTILLDAGFEEVEQILQIESGSVGGLIAQKRQELKIVVEEVKKIIHSYVDGLDEVSIDLLIQRKTSLKGFISDAGRVANVENLIRYLADAEFETKKIESNNLVVEIQRVLSELVKNIGNAEFDNLYAKYDYEKIDKIY